MLIGIRTLLQAAARAPPRRHNEGCFHRLTSPEASLLAGPSARRFALRPQVHRGRRAARGVDGEAGR